MQAFSPGTFWYPQKIFKGFNYERIFPKIIFFYAALITLDMAD
jgi:hypothetical protein